MEKLGGKPLTFFNLAFFCIDACMLTVLKHVGSHWSWHNNSDDSSTIIGRLDRTLVNHSWIDVLPDSYEYQSLAYSDRAPMVLHLLKSSSLGPKPFRFFNYWMHCPGFKAMLQRIWTSSKVYGTPQYQAVRTLKDIKKAIKEWKKKDNISTKAKLSSIRNQPKEVHQSMGAQSLTSKWQTEERKLTSELSHWLKLEEEYRRNWLLLGDKNTSFFLVAKSDNTEIRSSNW